MLDIRRASSADLDVVAPLFKAYRDFYGRISSEPDTRAFLRERMVNGESVILLGRLDGCPAGFTQLYPLFSSVGMSRIWLLNDLYVSESTRRRGVASALLEAARQYATETGASELLLQTDRGNHAAQVLYERLGWRRQDDYYWYDFEL